MFKVSYYKVSINQYENTTEVGMHGKRRIGKKKNAD